MFRFFVEITELYMRLAGPETKIHESLPILTHMYTIDLRFIAKT